MTIRRCGYAVMSVGEKFQAPGLFFYGNLKKVWYKSKKSLCNTKKFKFFSSIAQWIICCAVFFGASGRFRVYPGG
jgi:hypothetical protein